MSVKTHYSISGTQPTCDVCGKPAAWRQRSLSACCLYGEVLCDQCERHSHVRWQEKRGSLIEDVGDVISWGRDWITGLSRKRRWGRDRYGRLTMPVHLKRNRLLNDFDRIAQFANPLDSD